MPISKRYAVIRRYDFDRHSASNRLTSNRYCRSSSLAIGDIRTDIVGSCLRPRDQTTEAQMQAYQPEQACPSRQKWAYSLQVANRHSYFTAFFHLHYHALPRQRIRLVSRKLTGLPPQPVRAFSLIMWPIEKAICAPGGRGKAVNLIAPNAVKYFPSTDLATPISPVVSKAFGPLI